MGFWNQLPSDSEIDQADMLESYTRWVRGEKLSGRQRRFLRVFQEQDSGQLMKEMVDLAYQFYQGEELANVISSLESIAHMPSSEVQQRMKDNLLRSIRQNKVKSGTVPGYIPQPAYSPDQLGSESELAYNNNSSHSSIEHSMDELTILDNQVQIAATETLAPISLSDWKLTLEVETQGEEVKEFNFDIKRVTFGSAQENTIPLMKNATVSPTHCQLTIEEDQIYLTDLNSQSGTLVNGTAIQMPTLITVSSVIKIGTQSFEVIEIEREARTLMISFEELQGQQKGQVFTVQIRHLILGRSEKSAHIHIPDPNRTLSRQHAQFELRGNEIYLTDLDSTNGTFVDEIRIDKPTPITVGSSIRFGNICCRASAIEPI